MKQIAGRNEVEVGAAMKQSLRGNEAHWGQDEQHARMK
jgi:hypothetical protein